MKLQFYYCEICGKVITILSDSGVPTICCGQSMKKLEANHTDGAFEKHVPVYHINGNVVEVQIGSVLHPMLSEHMITWIGLCTKQGFQFKDLKAGDMPCATFKITDEDRVESVYAYCNIHGLWCSETEGGEM